MSTVGGLEVPAVEICMFLSRLQQQLEARAGQCLSLQWGTSPFPYFLLDVTLFSVAHAITAS